MTNQNNAAHVAGQILTYLGYAQAVSMEPGADSRRDHIQSLINSLLTALRVSVADAPTWNDDYKHDVHMFQRKAAAAPVADELSLEAQEHGHRRYEEGFAAGWGQCVASAPVAGEAVALRRDERLRETAANFLNAYRARYGGVYGQIKKHAPLQDQVLALVFASREAPPADDAAPQASEAVRIQFPAHLRKMWSGGEVQAWLDEHQGVTPPKVSAKGSLERYRKWQAEREEAFGAGVKAAADLVKKMVDDYDTDHGSTDPETGTREYPGDGAAWVCDMEELEGSIRALSAQPAQKEQSDEN